MFFESSRQGESDVKTVVNGTMAKKIYLVAIQSAIYVFLYYITNYVACLRNIDREWVTIPAIDCEIPFLGFFVWPYLSAYLLNTVGVVLIAKEMEYEEFKKITAAYFANLIILVGCYFIIPMKAVRTDFNPDGSFSLWAVDILHEAMFPYNTFPSAHVSYSFLTGLAAYAGKYKYRVFVMIDSALIILSTLFIKEHVLIDVAVGMILATVCFKEREKLLKLYKYVAGNYFGYAEN